VPRRRERVITALILLPRFYNPDRRGKRRPIERQNFKLTGEEVAKKFGGVTIHDSRSRGFWRDRGLVHEDVLMILEVDIPDTSKARTELTSYVRARLLRRFRQRAIYIKFVGPVERMLVTGEKVVPKEKKGGA
jgi:hypothetical protein